MGWIESRNSNKHCARHRTSPTIMSSPNYQLSQWCENKFFIQSVSESWTLPYTLRCWGTKKWKKHFLLCGIIFHKQRRWSRPPWAPTALEEWGRDDCEEERYDRRDTIEMLFVNMYKAMCCGGNVAEGSGRSKAGGETIDVRNAVGYLW